MKIYAVIPARGGSKGLPGKNVMLFGGKPLVAHAISAAMECGHVDRVFVSTDSPGIASHALRHGAEVITRPPEISGDEASSESALLHALGCMEEKPDILLFLQCTAPLVTSADVSGVLTRLIEDKADSCVAVSPFHHFLWVETPSGAMGVNHDGAMRKRRQDLKPQYLEAGSVYAMRTSRFQDEKTRFCGKTTLYVMDDPHRCLEIDDMDDFVVAEAVRSWRQEKGAAAKSATWLPARIDAIVCDFDGVFTDNAVYTAQNGEEIVRCDRGDGHGIAMLKKRGIPLLVLSAETNTVVKARCDKLGIECLQGVADKRETLAEWLQKRGFDWENIVYVGNDLADVACLKKAHAGVCPADSHAAVLAAADFVLSKKGGAGALRELSEIVCGEKN